MKLIIEVEKDYYEMIKYNVEHGQEYKPFEIIANGIPYDDKERGKGMTIEQIKILNESITNIKMLCKQYDLCRDCPMYENCNFMPSKWHEL